MASLRGEIMRTVAAIAALSCRVVAFRAVASFAVVMTAFAS
jgi:hypothetical protein